MGEPTNRELFDMEQARRLVRQNQDWRGHKPVWPDVLEAACDRIEELEEALNIELAKNFKYEQGGA